MEFKLLDKSTNHTSRTEMIKRISAKGHDIKYYCGYKKEKKDFGLPKANINYITMPPVPKLRVLFFLVGILWHMKKFFFFRRPDVLIIDYSINLLAVPLLLLKKAFNRKTKVILDVRTFPVNVKKYNRSQKFFFFSLFLARLTCDGITFITPFMREYCLNKVGLTKKKSSTWTSGFSEDIFEPSKYPKTRSEGVFEIFYHGGISIDRGVGSLIESCRLLRDKGYPVSLRLIGNVVEKKEIQELIQAHDLENGCKIYPPVPHEEIPQFIANCDLPVIPLPDFIGWRVSSPIKLMEYMAMGKSIVLTDIEAHRHVADNHRFAFFAQTSRPEDISDAVEKAYHSRNELDEWGKKAREIALDRYTWEHQAVKLLSFIDSF